MSIIAKEIGANGSGKPYTDRPNFGERFRSRRTKGRTSKVEVYDMARKREVGQAGATYQAADPQTGLRVTVEVKPKGVKT